MQEFQRQFVYTVPERVLFDSDLSINELKIYMIVRSFMDTTGIAYPSNNWIANKLGISRRKVIDNINRLVDKGYLQRTIKDGQRRLSIPTSYITEQDDEDLLVTAASPPSDGSVTPPSDGSVTQLTSKIINTKNIIDSSNNFTFEYKKLELDESGDLKRELKKKRFKEEALTDKKCNQVYRERFATLEVTIEELYEACCDYWGQRDQLVYKQRFLTHLMRCPVYSYPEKKKEGSRLKVNLENNSLRMKYQEYVGLIKANLRLGLAGDQPLPYEQWSLAYGHG